MPRARAGLLATPRRAVLVAATMYVALAVATSWPLARDARSHLVLGTEETSTVPAVSAWALWWNANRLAHGGADYWQAPIFAPAGDTFALSEPMPLPGVVTAPATWLDGPVMAANLWLLAALVLNGLAGRALARRLGVGPGLALAAGAAMLLLPFVFHELGVVTLAGVFGVVWTLDAIVALDAAGGAAGWRDGLRLGAALAVTYLCCGQYAVFAALAAGPPAAVLWATRRRERGRWIAAAVAVAVAAVAVAPVVVAQRRAAAIYPMNRSAARIGDGAASTWAWARTSGVEVVPQPALAADPPGQRALFPGIVKLGLALAAIALLLRGWRHHPQRRALGFLAATGVLALAWSTLPRAGGGWPVGALLASVPGLAQIRSVWRIGVIVQIVVVALAFVQLERWRTWATTPRRRVAHVGLALLAVIELWPRPPATAAAPDVAAWRPVLSWIEAHVPRDRAIAHLPMPATGAVADFAATGHWMLLGSVHGRRIINGYSSSFPPSHDQLWALGRGFPDAASTEALAGAGVAAVILDDRWLAEGDHRARVTAAGWRTALAAPTAGVTIVVR